MHKTAFESCLPTPGKQVPAGPDWIHEKDKGDRNDDRWNTPCAKAAAPATAPGRNPGPHERDEIERLLAEIDAALNQLDEMAERDAIGVQIITDAFKGRSARRSCGCA